MPRPTVAPPLVKQLQVKLGVVKRMVKEVQSYEKEAVAQENKISKMREDGRDPYDIKKQEEVLQESYMMIPDSKGRLQTSVQDLRSFLEENGDNAELAGTEPLTETTALLAKLDGGGEEVQEGQKA